MAKRKKKSRVPQPQHGAKSSPSRHDKRSRLDTPNPDRVETKEATVPLTGELKKTVQEMSDELDMRIGFRLMILIAGIMLASGRRTVTSWLVASGVLSWDRYYDLIRTIGRSTGKLVIPIVRLAVRVCRLDKLKSIVIAIDDTPTGRYGRHVEAANVHRNPTPGPAGNMWMYGHNWVVAALLLAHPLGGVIALPLLSLLYVRRESIEVLKQTYGEWTFKTKLEMARELIDTTVGVLRTVGIGAHVIVVMDGAYAASTLVRSLIKSGHTVISRLRSDAVLYELPGPRTGRRGRPCKYGKRINLKKRAAHPHGWEWITYCCRGEVVTKQFKTFLATTKVAGQVVRVVLLKHESGNWAAYFCTDIAMSVKEILETGAMRWAIEETFHDVKEVWGAGQQQVRNVHANIGCWHLVTWMYSLVELVTWNKTPEELVDRSQRPWDNPTRRPSHADRKRFIVREMLHEQLFASLPDFLKHTKMFDRLKRILGMAV